MTDAPPAPPAWLCPHGHAWSQATGPERMHDNPWFAVDAYDAVAPTGAPARYFVQRYKNLATGVLPLHEDGTVTLVGQWRFPFADFQWEIPEGGAPLHEVPLEGCKRELREEAGLEATDWRVVLTMQLSNSTSDELAMGWLATGLTPCATAPEVTEELTIARVPFAEALEAAVAGRLQDAITVAMLLRLHHMAVTGALEPGLALRVLKG